MNTKVRNYISVAACIIMGAIFVASGSGKLLGDIETPAQLMEFINSVMPEALLVPPVVHFIYMILVPYIFPILELVLGIFLLAGFVPRLSALLCLPLITAFVATNIWAITAGGYSTCASCFGIWEKIFGHLTPVQSLTIDIAMIILCLAIVFITPLTFAGSRRPFTAIIGMFKTDPSSNRLVALVQTLRYRFSIYGITDLLAGARRNTFALIGYLLGVAGIVLLVANLCNYNSSVVKSDGRTNGQGSPLSITDNITTLPVNYSSTFIEFSTGSPEIIDVLVYDRYGAIIGTWSENMTTTSHRILIDNLSPASTYYFQLLHSDRKGGKLMGERYSFTTMERPPAIVDCVMKEMTDSSATIEWETDRPTTSEIIYKISGSDEEHKLADQTLDTRHSATLEALKEGESYEFLIRSTDAYGHRLSSEMTGGFSLVTGSEVDLRAPDFELTSITGETFKLRQFRGKYVLLFFWNITCPICQKNIPVIEKIYSSMKNRDFAILAVHGPGREAAIRSYCEAENISFPVLLDTDGSVNNLFNVSHIPMPFIIDEKGIIRARESRFSNLEEFEQLLNDLMKTR